MNYLWEILLQAKDQGMGEKDIRYRRAKVFSPYMELAEDFINITRLPEPCEVEINPYYRFSGIFNEMFHPEATDYEALREGLFQLIMHQLGENDVKMGMTREEYYKRLLERELPASFSLFTRTEKEIFLEGLLLAYRCGDSMELLKQVVTLLIPSSIVYQNNDDPYELLVYIGRKKTGELEKKVHLILQWFAPLRCHADLYYEHHFGIIGVGETMRVDEIAVC